MKKIIRSICLFQKNPDKNSQKKLSEIEGKLEKTGYTIQIRRFCSPNKDFLEIEKDIDCDYYSIGTISSDYIENNFESFCKARSALFNLDLSLDIKKENPKPVGLCGLMLPCLEDFELAEEYEKGEFSIDRNIFLSLHSGLGIDTYPVGVDEKPEKVVNVLKLLQGLSNKYQKPLSARFVSDGKAKIGDKTNMQNQYLKDVIVRKLY